MKTVLSQRQGWKEQLGPGESDQEEMEKVAAVEDITGEVVEAREVDEVVLPGFRFHPTDQELVGFYLRRKVEKKPIGIDIIKQVDIYKYDPWDLPRVSNVGDKEWYFFCLRGRKYRNSIRPNRVTGSGFWKATGIDRPVYSSSAGDGNERIGLKKSLVYYRGNAGKGTKTDWMMHEFRLPTGVTSGGNNVGVGDGSIIQEAENWTICRIFKRTTPCKRQLPSRQLPSESNTKARGAESKHSVITYLEGTESNNSVITYFDETESNYNTALSYLQRRNQICAGQYWNPSAQAASAATSQLNYSTPNPNEFVFDEGYCCDELGRIVEFAVDPSLAADELVYNL